MEVQPRIAEKSFKLLTREPMLPLRGSIGDLQGIGVYSSDVGFSCLGGGIEGPSKIHATQLRDQSQSSPSKKNSI
jgi:hypothetical protein